MSGGNNIVLLGVPGHRRSTTRNTCMSKSTSCFTSHHFLVEETVSMATRGTESKGAAEPAGSDPPSAPQPGAPQTAAESNPGAQQKQPPAEKTREPDLQNKQQTAEQSSCECMRGMAPTGSSPRAGCVLVSACSLDTCHSTAVCQTGLDGVPRRRCSRRCSDGVCPAGGGAAGGVVTVCVLQEEVQQEVVVTVCVLQEEVQQEEEEVQQEVVVTVCGPAGGGAAGGVVMACVLQEVQQEEV
ncbi:hypothetical protein CRUP_012752 [Coryphaenoides rupestris]|nr:hypothetical protein CRUP_012752 [Coryphaenoides rupestris]